MSQPNNVNPNYGLVSSTDQKKDSTCNATYMAFATQKDYQGYYDAKDAGCVNANAVSPCDLKYVNAPPSVNSYCWTKSKTQDEHISCVVGMVNASKAPLPLDK